MSDDPPALLSSRTLVGLLADPARRAVFAALVLGADDLSSVVARSGCRPRDAAAALDRLVSAGLVEVLDDGHHHLLAGAFELAARREAPPPPPSDFVDQTGTRQRILDRAFDGGRLVALPARRSRRLVVLDHLVQRFEPGHRYTERQVNAMLATVDPDTAALRRYLVDEGMLDRAGGEYWRSGGTVPGDDDDDDDND